MVRITAVFGIFVFGLLLVSLLTFISDYPPEIQEEYYRSQHKETAKKPLSRIMAVKKIGALRRKRVYVKIVKV